VCEKEIHLTGTTKYVTDLLNLKAVQFWVQIERAELGNEELQVRPWCAPVSFGHYVRVESHTNQKIVCMRLMSVELYKGIEYFTIDEPFFL